MTTPPEQRIRTGMVKAADLPLHELLALREAGDSVLDHCLRRIVETAASGARDRVAAFNASPPRPE
jgi:FXSXX-COOH protein